MHITGSFKEATSSFIVLEDMDSDVAVILIDWIQEDRCTSGDHRNAVHYGKARCTAGCLTRQS